MLLQASKLMKIDEHRFDSMVQRCLMNAFSHEKGFQLAYQGFTIGDTAVDKRIVAWAEEEIDVDHARRQFAHHGTILRQWAQAMVEAYNGAPDEYQWARDPIVSRLSADRLNPVGEPLHDEMFRLIAEAAVKRPNK